MRSPSWSELPALALGAAVEGVWSGALAALVAGGSGAAYMAGAAAAVFAAAVFARRTGSGAGPGLLARWLAVALTLVVAGALFAAQLGWTSPHPLLSLIADVVFAALLVLLGIWLGRRPQGPHDAVNRAVRGFGLLCGLLVIAGMAGALPGWAAGAVVAALLAGGLLIAAVRYQALAAVVPPEDRAPAWRWLLAVVGVILLVVAVGALLSLVLRADVVLWALAVAGGALRFLLQFLAYGIGWAGAGLLRALAWLLALFHVHGLPTPKPPKAPPAHPVTSRQTPHLGTWGLARTIATIGAAVVAIGVPLLLVALALRRFRRDKPEAVEEERESVLTWREAAGDAAARLRRRLRRLAPRRPVPRTPAELVRRRYEELERRLARDGHERPPGTTVRAYLGGVCGTSGEGEGAAATTSDLAADLAAIYELARYSSHAVDQPTAQHFASLANAFGTALTTPA